MTYHYKALGLAAALALSPMAALAATVDINITSFGAGKNSANISGAIAAQNAFMAGSPIIRAENFDDFTACDNTNGGTCESAAVGATGNDAIQTGVGDFSGIGPTHSNGGSQVAPEQSIVVRGDVPNPYGRFSVVGNDDQWLDSNDLNGIEWKIPGSTGMSDVLKIAFFLTDMDDVGSTPFMIKVADETAPIGQIVSGVNGGRPDGELLLVTMLFSEPVSLLSIRMTTGKGDGFGADGFQVGTVPLPAAGWLMIAGLGGLAALRRRKRAA